MRRIALAVALAVLAACVTTGPKQARQFTSVWHGKSYADVKNNAPLAPDKARIYLFRTKAPFLWNQNEDVLVDGVKVGVAVDQSFLFVDLAAGSHKLSSSRQSDDGITLSIEAGEVRFVKAYWAGPWFKFSLVTKQDAEEEAMLLLSYRDEG